MPEISNFYGIVITMYFPEHNPPHFHVRYNQYRASIDIHTGKVTGEMPRRALKLVYDWLVVQIGKRCFAFKNSTFGLIWKQQPNSNG